ncbi:hypothetical protein V8G54_022437 [Vigna mungo]|uniref:CCHC-type domain-containing protein n=1 Tax=Vigna mungo TaxID=3915 RepID=A0AAQ3RYK4_VIGMU
MFPSLGGWTARSFAHSVLLPPLASSRTRFRAKCLVNYSMTVNDNLLSKPIRRANFRLCDVSGYVSEVLEIRAEAPKLHVLLVPGNPGVTLIVYLPDYVSMLGVVLFYKDFVEFLYELLEGTASVTTAIGHVSHSRKFVSYTEFCFQDLEHGRMFSLQEQIDHKIDFIRQELQNIEIPILLVGSSISHVGHSIGSYISIEMFKKSPEKKELCNRESHVEKMAGLIQNSLPVFNGKNFEDWCVKTDVILGFHEIDEIVKDEFKELAKTATEEEKEANKENRKLDCKAHMILHQCISATIFQKDGYGTAGNIKEIKLQSLRRQYELLNMGEQETIQGYIDRIQVIVNAMRACDKIVKDKKIVHKILRTLTPQYDHIVVAIVESRDLKKMKVEELQNSLEAHEQRLLERKAAEQDAIQISQALQAKMQKGRGFGRGRGRTRGGRGGRNGRRSANNTKQNKDLQSNKYGSCRGKGKSRGRGGKRNTDKRGIQCFTCNKFGHYSSECWHNEDNKKEKGSEVNLAKEEITSDSDHVALMNIVVDKRQETHGDSVHCGLGSTKVKCQRSERNFSQKERVSLPEESKHAEEHVSLPEETKHAEEQVSRRAVSKEICATSLNKDVSLAGVTNYTQEDMLWYLDSACSNHMTGNRKWLIDLDTGVKSTIRFADDSVVRAEGTGKVLIARKDGRPIYMHNVLYVPTMKSNLLSLGQLHEKGYTMKMEEGHIKVFDKRQRMILKAPIANNRTFCVNLNTTEI